jgi:DNA-binding FadR family transcriptional regulator
VSTYGVSKTVVRETVQALAALGLVRVQHGKRSVVLPESDWNILSPQVQEAFRAARLAYPLVQELYDVRVILEPPVTLPHDEPFV